MSLTDAQRAVLTEEELALVEAASRATQGRWFQGPRAVLVLLSTLATDRLALQAERQRAERAEGESRLHEHACEVARDERDALIAAASVKNTEQLAERNKLNYFAAEACARAEKAQHAAAQHQANAAALRARAEQAEAAAVQAERDATKWKADADALRDILRRLEWRNDGSCPLCPAVANPLYREHFENCPFIEALAPRPAATEGK